MASRGFLLSCFLISLLAVSPGCGKKSAEQTEEGSFEKPAHDYSFKNYLEKGDLHALKKRGVIRFVSLSGLVEKQLPRSEIVTQRHFDLANAFARHLGLKSQWIQAETPEHAIELVERGHADIIADNFTDTEQRRERLDFSVALEQTHQQLITGSKGPDISAPNKLRNVKLVIPSRSTHVQTAKQLIADHPDANLQMEEVPYNDELDTLMDLVNEHSNMATILDSNAAEGLRQYRDDIHIGANVSDTENIAWATRNNSPDLLLTLNNFLTETLVKHDQPRISDWEAIKESKVLRLITYNGPTSFFLWKGQLMGFDYDLARYFAEENGLHLQVIVAPYDADLIDWLKQGRGDIAGASTTITQQRKDQGIVFSSPYLEIPGQILSNKDKPKISSFADLKGRKLTLRAHSAFIKNSKMLKEKGIDFEIEVAAPDVSYQRIINMVADGEIDATIVDANAAEIEGSLRPKLQTGMLLGDPKPQGWMLMPQNRELAHKVNAFIEKFRKSDRYQKKLNAYFKPNAKFLKKIETRIVPGGPISPFDDLVRSSSAEHQFDWRLVTVQMWQESNFDPKAVSPVGAQGLMQVMPRTAEEMGFTPPLFDPERGIQAGVKYLNWVRGRFDPTVPLDNKLWFILASYNAGYGHLLDAQRLAKQLGYDPNVWFGNVEKAMLKLSEPRYFKKARYGYVRGAEPVQYVRNISTLYKAYTGVATGNVSILLFSNRLSMNSYQCKKPSPAHNNW